MSDGEADRSHRRFEAYIRGAPHLKGDSLFFRLISIVSTWVKGSYESSGNALLYEVWWPNLLQGVIELQTQMYEFFAWGRHTSKTYLFDTYLLEKIQNFSSADSSGCPLSDEVWKPAQSLETAKWQAERLREPLLSHHPSTVVPSSLNNMPEQFGVSHSHCFEQIRLPYLIWKRRSWAICGYKKNYFYNN